MIVCASAVNSSWSKLRAKLRALSLKPSINRGNATIDACTRATNWCPHLQDRGCSAPLPRPGTLRKGKARPHQDSTWRRRGNTCRSHIFMCVRHSVCESDFISADHTRSCTWVHVTCSCVWVRFHACQFVHFRSLGDRHFMPDALISFVVRSCRAWDPLMAHNDISGRTFHHAPPPTV